MSRIGMGFLLAIALLIAGCGGYGSNNYMNGPGMPTITHLSPGSTASGGLDFDLTVVGTGFGTDSLVYWGTTTRATTYVDSMHVKAAILAADIMTMGTVQVYVHTGGANSNSKPFDIQ